jgi:hypothetical protein
MFVFNESILTVLIRELAQRMNEILAIFDQIIFHKAKFDLLFLMAITETTSSGSDVPRAIIVNQIIESFIQKNVLIASAHHTTHFAQKISHIIQITIYRKALGIDSFSISITSSSLDCIYLHKIKTIKIISKTNHSYHCRPDPIFGKIPSLMKIYAMKVIRILIGRSFFIMAFSIVNFFIIAITQKTRRIFVILLHITLPIAKPSAHCILA